MTLKRLMTVLLVVMLLAGGGVFWLWEYAHTPAGRARTIFAQIRGDTTTTRGWMIAHGLIKSEVVDREADDSYGLGVKGRTFLPQATDKLSALGPDAVTVAMEALSDSDWRVRQAAAIVCGDSREERTVQPLVQCLRQYRSSDDDCIEALSKVGNAPAVEAILLASASEGHTPRTRDLARVKITHLSDRSLAAVFIRRLRDPDGSIRANCAQALAALAAPQAAEPLLRAIREAASGGAPAPHAAEALEQCGRANCYDLLAHALEDEHLEVRQAALRALRVAADKRAAGPVLRLLAKGNPRETVLALNVLEELDDPRAPQAFDTALRKFVHEGRSHEDRIYMAGFLARKGRATGMDLLLGRLHSVADRDLRPSVVSELRTCVLANTSLCPRVLQALTPLATDEDEDVRCEVAKALGEIRLDGSRALLRKMLQDPSDSVRRDARNSIEMMDENEFALPPASMPAEP